MNHTFAPGGKYIIPRPLTMMTINLHGIYTIVEAPQGEDKKAGAWPSGPSINI